MTCVRRTAALACLVSWAPAAALAQDATTRLPTVQISSSDAYPDGATVASGGFLVDKPTVGPFGTASQLDIPFSTNSIPQKIIIDQQAKTRADVLRNDPSTTLVFPSSQAGYSNFSIRGFDASDSQSNRVDGLPFTTQASELLYDYERVDIYKGANGLLYGFSSPGGIVNYVSKKPLAVAYTETSLNYISPTWFGGTVDVSRRFGDTEQLGVRLNAAGHSGQLGVDGQTNKDALVALALDWRVLPGARVWVNSAYSRNDYQGLQPNFALGAFNVPQAPDTSKLHGLPFSQHVGTSETIEGGIEGDFLPWLSGHITAGEVAGYRNVRYSGATLVDNVGNYKLAIDPHNLWHLTDYSEEAILSPHFEAGIFKDKLDIGATFNRETYIVNNINGAQTIGTFNLYGPVLAGDPQTQTGQVFLASSQTDFNNYLVRDTLDITRYVTLIGGIAHATYANVTSGNPKGLSQSANTPSGAVLIKPTDHASIYASYIQGLQQGGQAAQTFGAGTVTNAFAQLAPYLSEQYEVGAKYRFGDALEINGDLFQITQQNAIYTPNDAAGMSYTFSADGVQRNRGAEITMIGQVFAGARVFAGAAYIDPRIEKSSGGTLDGLNAIGVPRVRGNVYLEYDIAPIRGLTLLGGMFYTGRTYDNSGNTQVVPEYVTGDLGFKYATPTAAGLATLRVYVQNITGANYFGAQETGGLFLGAPRTYKVDMSMRF